MKKSSSIRKRIIILVLMLLAIFLSDLLTPITIECIIPPCHQPTSMITKFLIFLLIGIILSWIISGLSKNRKDKSTYTNKG